MKSAQQINEWIRQSKHTLKMHAHVDREVTCPLVSLSAWLNQQKGANVDDLVQTVWCCAINLCFVTLWICLLCSRLTQTLTPYPPSRFFSSLFSRESVKILRFDYRRTLSESANAKWIERRTYIVIWLWSRGRESEAEIALLLCGGWMRDTEHRHTDWKRKSSSRQLICSLPFFQTTHSLSADDFFVFLTSISRRIVLSATPLSFQNSISIWLQVSVRRGSKREQEEQERIVDIQKGIDCRNVPLFSLLSFLFTVSVMRWKGVERQGFGP